MDAFSSIFGFWCSFYLYNSILLIFKTRISEIEASHQYLCSAHVHYRAAKNEVHMAVAPPYSL